MLSACLSTPEGCCEETADVDGRLPAATATSSAAAVGAEGFCGEAAGLAVVPDACCAAGSAIDGFEAAGFGAAAVSTGGSRSVLCTTSINSDLDVLLHVTIYFNVRIDHGIPSAIGCRAPRKTSSRLISLAACIAPFSVHVMSHHLHSCLLCSA